MKIIIIVCFFCLMTDYVESKDILNLSQIPQRFLNERGFSFVAKEIQTNQLCCIDKNQKIKSLREQIKLDLNRVFAKKWVPDSIWRKLIAIKGNGKKPDCFIVQYFINEDSVDLVINENRVTITIRPSRFGGVLTEKKDVQNAYNKWVDNVFSSLKKGGKSFQKITEKPTFYILNQEIINNEGFSRVYAARSWPESIKGAFAKDYSWISFSVTYILPNITRGEIKGFKILGLGEHWFDEKQKWSTDLSRSKSKKEIKKKSTAKSKS